jgi:hypothetical protein
VRIKRVEYVSGLAGWSVSEPASGAAAPAGYAGWQPRLIVPEHNNVSFEWLAQTRLMFASREWRVRRVDYENAPRGREVLATSPYRWWLGLVAWADHVISGRPSGPSLEQAALVADPLLHLLLLAGATVFVAWQFGVFPAAMLSIGVAALFPLTSEFIPGAPNDHGLAQAFALWSVLPVLAGIGTLHSAAANPGRLARRWFFTAGVAGAVGLWISVTTIAPVLIGIALGAIIAAWILRGSSTGIPTRAPEIAPWRAWALGGATASLGACLIEYFPAHLAYWELRVIHPLYGIAWLGGGEALARIATWIQRGKAGRSSRDVGIWVLAAAAIAGVPFAMWRTHSLGFLTVDFSALRLMRLPDSPVETNSFAWIIKDGFTATVLATLLPLLLLLPAILLLVRHKSESGHRASIAFSLGPVLVALGFACRQLSWWNGLDGVLLALLVTMTAALSGAAAHRLVRWIWFAIMVLALLPGAIQVTPRQDAGKKNALNQAEVVGLIERDLARWMAIHAGAEGTLVLAPPDETPVMYYYGRMRGLATLGWENQDGRNAAARIVSASSPNEAQELIGEREITHIVIPRWDPYLDIYARNVLGRFEGSFINRLHHWVLPPWLRPVPYLLPTIGGFEGQSVTVFEVVEDQDDATAAGRLVEYFVEMDQLDLAQSAARSLRRFPSDLGALVARAQVENALNDTNGFAHTVGLIVLRLSNGADRILPLDRRVSLAVVLALGQHMDLAEAQVRECMNEIDEEKLRSLSAGSLYHLEVLSKSTGLGIGDPRLRELALDLLPQFLRDRFDQNLQ